MIAGGKDSRGIVILYASEEYDPVLNQTLPVGRTREKRMGSSFCNKFLCGGHETAEAATPERSCEKFYGKNFELLPVSLLEPRKFHLCWGLKSGEVILLGGEGSSTTSEVVSADGTSSSLSFGLIAQTS